MFSGQRFAILAMFLTFQSNKRTNLEAYLKKDPISDQGRKKRTYLAALHKLNLFKGGKEQGKDVVHNSDNHLNRGGGAGG